MNIEQTATVHYDFYHGWDVKKEHRICGSTCVKGESVARRIVEIMNEVHGEGTHWIVLDEQV